MFFGQCECGGVEASDTVCDGVVGKVFFEKGVVNAKDVIYVSAHVSEVL